MLAHHNVPIDKIIPLNTTIRSSRPTSKGTPYLKCRKTTDVIRSHLTSGQDKLGANFAVGLNLKNGRSVHMMPYEVLKLSVEP